MTESIAYTTFEDFLAAEMLSATRQSWWLVAST